jgi:hypothetical protein
MDFLLFIKYSTNVWPKVLKCENYSNGMVRYKKKPLREPLPLPPAI